MYHPPPLQAERAQLRSCDLVGRPIQSQGRFFPHNLAKNIAQVAKPEPASLPPLPRWHYVPICPTVWQTVLVGSGHCMNQDCHGLPL